MNVEWAHFKRQARVCLRRREFARLSEKRARERACSCPAKVLTTFTCPSGIGDNLSDASRALLLHLHLRISRNHDEEHGSPSRNWVVKTENER